MKSLMIGDHDNFAPRLGFAYQLTERTVLRGGYGISFVYFPFSDFGVNSQRMVPFSINVANTSDLFRATIPGFDFDAGGPRQVLLSAPVLSIAGLSPDIQWGDVHQWSLDLQQEFPGNLVFDLGYIGNKASHLAQRFPTNNPLTPGSASLQIAAPVSNLRRSQPGPVRREQSL